MIERGNGSGQSDIANQVVQSLSGDLTKDVGLEVIDRSHLQELFHEQNMFYSDRMSRDDIAKIGKINGVDIILFLTVNNYSVTAREELSNRVIMMQAKDYGKVSLTCGVQAVMVERGSLISSASENNNDQPDKLLHSGSARVASSTPQQVKYDVLGQQELLTMYASTFSSMAADAALEVANKLYTDLKSELHSAPLPAAGGKAISPVGASAEQVVVAGILAGGQVLITGGSSNGLKEGEKLQVFRTIDSGIVDPRTKQPILRKRKICEITLADVQETSSTGTCQGDLPKANDTVVPETGK